MIEELRTRKEYLEQFRKDAEEILNTWFALLDWPRTSSPILPIHYNFASDGLQKYAKKAGITVDLSCPRVRSEEEVLADHVIELASGCEKLVDELSEHLDPIFGGFSLWEEVKDLRRSLNKPKPKDPILYSDFYNPMKIIYNLTLLFLSPFSYDVGTLTETSGIVRAIVAPESYWNTFKNKIGNGDVIFFNLGTTVFAQEEMLNLLNSKNIKVVILLDTQMDLGSPAGSFKDLFYKSDFLTGGPFYTTPQLSDCAKAHFGVDRIHYIFDYPVDSEHKLPDVVRWFGDLDPELRGFDYRYFDVGHIIEAPYDGVWWDVDTLSHFLTFKPCHSGEQFEYNIIYWFGSTTTDMPGFHEYPTVVDTLKAMFGPKGVIVYT